MIRFSGLLLLFVTSTLVLAHPTPTRGDDGTDLLSKLAIDKARDPRPVRRMSLAEVFSHTLAENLDVAVSHVDLELADTRYQLQTAPFDPFFSGSTDWRTTARPSTNVSQGSGSYEADNKSWSFGLTKPFQDGSALTTALSHSRSWSSASSWQSINPTYGTGLSLNYSRPLLRGAGRDNTLTYLRVAANGKKQSWQAFRLQVSASLLQTEKAYWDLVLALEDLEVKRIALIQAEDLVRTNEERKRLGLLAPNEVTVIEAEAGAALRREAVIVARDSLEDARERLARLMGESARPDEALVPAEGPSPVTRTKALDAQLALALANRPELLQTRIDLASKKLLVDYARNQKRNKLNFRGSVDLTSAADGRRSSFDQMTSLDYPNYFLGLELEIPLFNRRARQNHREALLNREQSVMKLQDLERQISSEVRLALAQVGTNQKRIEASALAARLAERKLDAERERYRQGLVTTHDLLIFQEQLASAKSRAVIARVDYAKSLADLTYATGRYLPFRCIMLTEEGGRLGDGAETIDVGLLP